MCGRCGEVWCVGGAAFWGNGKEWRWLREKCDKKRANHPPLGHSTHHNPEYHHSAGVSSAEKWSYSGLAISAPITGGVVESKNLIFVLKNGFSVDTFSCFSGLVFFWFFFFFSYPHHKKHTPWGRHTHKEVRVGMWPVFFVNGKMVWLLMKKMPPQKEWSHVHQPRITVIVICSCVGDGNRVIRGWSTCTRIHCGVWKMSSLWSKIHIVLLCLCYSRRTDGICGVIMCSLIRLGMQRDKWSFLG